MSDYTARIDQLIYHRRPSITVPHQTAVYDQYLAAIAGLAGTSGDDYMQRMQDLADQAHRWGVAALAAHTDSTPSESDAVYYGGIRLGAYLAAYAVGVYCRTHPTTREDDTLHEIVDDMVSGIARDAPVDQMMTVGMRLRRHATTCGYIAEHDLQVLLHLSRVGTVTGTAQQLAVRGTLTRAAFWLISGIHADQVKAALRAAPIPATA